MRRRSSGAGPEDGVDAHLQSTPLKKKPFAGNVYMVSIAFFFIFMSFNTAQALESTIIKDTTMANISLGTLYFVFTVLGIVAPRLVNKMGPRLSMVLGGAPYALVVIFNIFIVENYKSHPNDSSSALPYALSITAFFLVGVGAPLLWTGQGIYLMRNGIRHAKASGMAPSDATARFNGIFYAAFQFNGAVGNVLAGIILLVFSSNPEDAAVYMYIGLACSAGVGLLVVFFLRSVGSTEAQPDSSPLSDVENIRDALLEKGDAAEAPTAAPEQVGLMQTLKQLKDPKMLLLVPIIFYNGVSLGFFLSNFPNMVTRPLTSKTSVPFIVASFYLANTAATYMWGQLTSKIGRTWVTSIAGLAHIVFFIVFPIIVKVQDEIDHGFAAHLLVIVMAIVFAVGDSVWESFPPAILQNEAYFPKESDRDAAMSNLKIWQSLGFALQFGISAADSTIPYVMTAYIAALLLVSLAVLFCLHKRVINLNAGLEDVLNKRKTSSEDSAPLLK